MLFFLEPCDSLYLYVLFRLQVNHPYPSSPSASLQSELESSVSLRSEDAHPLGEALHVCILPALLIIRGRRGRRRHEVSGVWQSVFPGKHLPAAVVALVGDVAPAQFSLQLPQVQPSLIVL